MKLNPAFPDNSLMGQVLSLAYSTFYDALPSNAQNRAPIAPATPEPPKRAGFVRRSLAAIDGWFDRQRQNDRDAYLAQSLDLADLERRLRKLERNALY